MFDDKVKTNFVIEVLRMIMVFPSNFHQFIISAIEDFLSEYESDSLFDFWYVLRLKISECYVHVVLQNLF